MSLTSACKISSLATEIMWTLERSKWGCFAAVTTAAVKPKKMKARELTSLTSLLSGNCTSIFKHSWQDFNAEAVYSAQQSALLGIWWRCACKNRPPVVGFLSHVSNGSSGLVFKDTWIWRDVNNNKHQTDVSGASCGSRRTSLTQRVIKLISISCFFPHKYANL